MMLVFAFCLCLDMLVSPVYILLHYITLLLADMLVLPVYVLLHYITERSLPEPEKAGHRATHNNKANLAKPN